MKNKPQSSKSDSRADEIFFGGLLGTALAGIIFVVSYPAFTTNEIVAGFLIGCVLGLVGGGLLHYVRVDTKRKFGEILNYVFLGPIVLLPALLIVLFLWGILLTGTESIIEYFNIPTGLSNYLIIFVNILTFLIITYILWNFFFGGMSKSMLVNKVDIEELETKHVHDDIPFGLMVNEWESFKSKIGEDDEVWYWSTSPRTWKMMVGRCGYVIVRNGHPTRHSIVTGMN